MLEIQKSIDPWVWAYLSKIQLVTSVFRYRGHEFQMRPMSVKPPEKTIRKGTQGTFTESEVLSSLHGMIHGYYRAGVYYLFPNKDKVADFSKSRFKPLITGNPETIGRHLKDTDSATLKRVGTGFLYFRSGRLAQDVGSRGDMKSSANLKGDPADHAVMDEYDEMDVKVDEFVDGRLAKSPVHTKVYLANPTLPDYMSDRKFQRSSQEYWHIKCHHCGWYTCLDDEDLWPEDGSPCLAIRRRPDGSAYRCCQHCEREIDPRLGQWVAKNPDIKDHLGFTIGHPSYPWINVNHLLKQWENPELDRGNFVRLKLGRPYIEAENRLSVQEVLNCCADYGMRDKDKGPCFMGIDQGGADRDLFHVIISKRLTDIKGRKAQILKISVEKGWQTLDTLMKLFHVTRCVIDALPEQKNARSFAERWSGRVFLSYFSETQKGSYVWKEDKLEVHSNRTEAMDYSHDEIANTELVLPRQSLKRVQEYAKHCHATAKKLEENEKTGEMRYIYVPKLGGPDHFRLAQCYESMARNGAPKRMFNDA